MKVVAHTNLVPVRRVGGSSFREPFDIFGVSPENAIAMVNSGEAELVEIPADTETYDFPDPTALVEELEEPEKDGDGDGLIDIPADWQTQHYIKQIHLAKALAGDSYVVPDGERPTDYAVKVIEAEIARRANLKATDEGSANGSESENGGDAANQQG